MRRALWERRDSIWSLRSNPLMDRGPGRRGSLLHRTSTNLNEEVVNGLFALDDGCKEDVDGAASTKGNGGKATSRQSVLTLVNAVLGAGVLGFPYVYRTCGLVLATALVGLVVAASSLSMRLLILAAGASRRASYEDLAAACFGTTGRACVDGCVLAMNLGSLVAYLNIMADTASSVAGSIVPPGAEPRREAVLVALTLLLALPVTLSVRSTTLLAAISQVSVTFLFFFGGATALTALAPATPISELHLWRPGGLLVAFPLVVYGFTAHQILFSIYDTLQSASVRSMTRVIHHSMALSTAMYLVVGAAGYVANGPSTAGDLLRNLGGGARSPGRRAFERALRVGYGLSILGTLPLVVLPLRAVALRALPPADPAAPLGAAASPSAAPWRRLGARLVTEDALRVAIDSGFLLCACVLASAVPNVEFAFGLAGSTASVLLAFVLPGAIFLRVDAAVPDGLAFATTPSRSTPRPGCPAPDRDATCSTPRRASLSSPASPRRRTPALPTSPRRRRGSQAAWFLVVLGLAGMALCTHALVVEMVREARVARLARTLAREASRAAEAAAAGERARTEAAHASGIAAARARLARAGAAAAGLDDTLRLVLQHVSAQEATGSGAGEARLPHSVRLALGGASARLEASRGELVAVARGLEEGARLLRSNVTDTAAVIGQALVGDGPAESGRGGGAVWSALQAAAAMADAARNRAERGGLPWRRPGSGSRAADADASAGSGDGTTQVVAVLSELDVTRRETAAALEEVEMDVRAAADALHAASITADHAGDRGGAGIGGGARGGAREALAAVIAAMSPALGNVRGAIAKLDELAADRLASLRSILKKLGDQEGKDRGVETADADAERRAAPETLAAASKLDAAAVNLTAVTEAAERAASKLVQRAKSAATDSLGKSGDKEEATRAIAIAKAIATKGRDDASGKQEDVLEHAQRHHDQKSVADAGSDSATGGQI